MVNIINNRSDFLIPKIFGIDLVNKNRVLNQIAHYQNSIGVAHWFWQKVKSYNGMQLLDIVDSTRSIEETALALLNAFKNPGTINTLYRILQSIFGQESAITITEKQGALDFDITINSKDNAFFYYWFTKQNIQIITKKGVPLVFKKTTSLGYYGDIKSFLKLFVCDGVIIDNVNIKLSQKLLTQIKKGEIQWQNNKI